MTAKFLEYPNGYPVYEDDNIMLRNTDNSLKISNLKETNLLDEEELYSEKLINVSEPLAITTKSE